MAYISGSITEDSKIIVLDSDHNKITSKDFTPDSYTKLLLHFDEAPLADSSSAPKVLTLNGSVARSATQSKFGEYSGSFDGSTKYIKISSAADWSFGTGDFTIEYWVRFSQLAYSGSTSPANQYITDLGSNYMFTHISVGRYIHFERAAANAVITYDLSPVINTWYHVAWIRSGGTLYLFVDGTLRTSAAFTDNITSSSMAVGDFGGGGPYGLNGYLDELRISKGVARWTSNFTPPTQAYKTPAPFMYNLNGADRYAYSINNLTSTSGTVIAVSNEGEIAGYQTTSYISDVDSYTKLLLHFDESPLIDTIDKSLILNGGIARSNTQSKFGGYSGYFDGNGDYIDVLDSADWNFDANNFTIDLWTNFKDFNSTYGLVSHAASGTTVNSNWSFFYSQTNGLHFSIREGGTFRVDIEQGSPTAGWVANTWYHLAVVRSGSTFTIYRNGISLGSATWGGTMVSYSIPLHIGIARKTDGLITQEFYGYLDEVRISKGVDRWTSNFTPPTSAYI